MNTSLSAVWLIIFETCLKDDSGIDLHDTDIDFSEPVILKKEQPL